MSQRRMACCSRWLMLLLSLGWTTTWAQDVAPTSGPVRVRFATSAGSFTLELNPTRAPLSVANFVQYVRAGHYDGTLFHRVIGNFVVQAGGYTVAGAEKPVRVGVPNESGNGLSNRRGTVAMARNDDPHGATSQFFINVVDNIALDPGPSRWGYAVIGRVVEGMDTLDRIASVATGARGPFPEDTPLEPVVIESATLVAATAVSP